MTEDLEPGTHPGQAAIASSNFRLPKTARKSRFPEIYWRSDEGSAPLSSAPTKGRSMTRAEIVLAAMAAGGRGVSFDGLRIQKLLFLIDVEIPGLVEGPHFDFAAYNYGPFDKSLYEVLGDLERRGCVAQGHKNGYPDYALTSRGNVEGGRFLGTLSPEAREFMESAAKWLRLSTFRRILTVIYRKYPEMARNSIVPELRAPSFRAAHRFVLPSFLSGVSRIFDFTGSLDPPIYEESPEQADAMAIRQDWEAVGDDLEHALAAFGPPEPAR